MKYYLNDYFTAKSYIPNEKYEHIFSSDENERRINVCKEVSPSCVLLKYELQNDGINVCTRWDKF